MSRRYCSRGTRAFWMMVAGWEGHRTQRRGGWERRGPRGRRTNVTIGIGASFGHRPFAMSFFYGMKDWGVKGGLEFNTVTID